MAATRRKKPTSKGKNSQPTRSAKGVRSPLSWHDRGTGLLVDYLSIQKKGPKGCLCVFTFLGDLVLAASQKKDESMDWTSLGSLLASCQSLISGLDQLLSSKTSSLIFDGSKGQGFWLRAFEGKWLVLGRSVPYNEQRLRSLEKHLKTYKGLGGASRGHFQEALEGLSDAGIDQALSHTDR